MNDKEAIDILKNIISDEVIGTYCIEIQKEVDCSKNCENEDCYLIQAIETILNLIENQKAELKKKDKEIDLMAVKLKQLREASLDDCFIPKSYRDIDDCLRITCEECIKQYFENKAEESK